MWLGLCIVFFLFNFFVSLLPLGGFLTVFVNVLVIGGVAHIASQLDLGHQASFGSVFHAAKQHPKPLLMIAAANFGLTLLAILVALVPMLVVWGGDMFLPLLQIFSGSYPADQVQEADTVALGLSVMVSLLLFMLLLVPIMMLYWFAPALVVLAGLKPRESMKMSFIACKRNMLPFLLYGLLMMFCLVITVITFFIAMLFFGPILMISLYTSYKSIFCEEVGLTTSE